MSKSTIKAVQIILLSSVVFLAGCNAPIAQPTLDPNMIYTAAAQTVQAQLAVASAGTATAAAVPPTQAAPTQGPTLLATVPANPSPTFTMGATLSINLTPGVTALAPGLTPVVLGTPVVGGPTASIAIATLPPTAAPVVDTSGDKGILVNQDPDDGSLIGKNQDFDETFKIQNTGTTTWNPTDYDFRLYSDNGLAKHNYYTLNQTVKPHEIVSAVVDMKTPNNSGQYKSSWCLINKNNISKCVALYWVIINVP